MKNFADYPFLKNWLSNEFEWAPRVGNCIISDHKKIQAIHDEWYEYLGVDEKKKPGVFRFEFCSEEKIHQAEGENKILAFLNKTWEETRGTHLVVNVECSTERGPQMIFRNDYDRKRLYIITQQGRCYHFSYLSPDLNKSHLETLQGQARLIQTAADKGNCFMKMTGGKSLILGHHPTTKSEIFASYGHTCTQLFQYPGLDPLTDYLFAMGAVGGDDPYGDPYDDSSIREKKHRIYMRFVSSILSDLALPRTAAFDPQEFKLFKAAFIKGIKVSEEVLPLEKNPISPSELLSKLPTLLKRTDFDPKELVEVARLVSQAKSDSTFGDKEGSQLSAMLFILLLQNRAFSLDRFFTTYLPKNYGLREGEEEYPAENRLPWLSEIFEDMDPVTLEEYAPAILDTKVAWQLERMAPICTVHIPNIFMQAFKRVMPLLLEYDDGPRRIAEALLSALGCQATEGKRYIATRPIINALGHLVFFESGPKTFSDAQLNAIGNAIKVVLAAQMPDRYRATEKVHTTMKATSAMPFLERLRRELTDRPRGSIHCYPPQYK